MLTQKKDNTTTLSTVNKGGAKIIKLNKPAEDTDNAKEKKEEQPDRPPLNEFNTSYMKGRDNDLL